MKLTVIKIGGRALESPDAPRELAEAAAGLPGRVLFVHGGGAEISTWCRNLGIEPRFVDGLRVTDAKTLPVVAAVLAGLANKRLVMHLRVAGLNAVGISGVDGGLLDVIPHEDHARLGAVGIVTNVHPALLRALLAAGWTPVVAGLGAHEGNLLNLNADEVARALAVRLQVDDLILLSDTPALRIEDKPVTRVDADEIDALLDHPDVMDGMRPKLRASRDALLGGVPRVHIGTWTGSDTLKNILAGRSEGTTLQRDPHSADPRILSSHETESLGTGHD